jgi:hypothetical protein
MTTCSRRWAATLATVLALAAAIAAWSARGAHEQPDRTIGFGQVKFEGLGPERWAQRWRREHRAVLELRARLASRLAPLIGLVRAFECVHDGEGSWGANTGNGYFGGLQFDRSFMVAYAPGLLRRKGTANHWSPAEQIAAAIVAHTVRGFEPWPVTARRCGLR